MTLAIVGAGFLAVVAALGAQTLAEGDGAAFEALVPATLGFALKGTLALAAALGLDRVARRASRTAATARDRGSFG